MWARTHTYAGIHIHTHTQDHRTMSPRISLGHATRVRQPWILLWPHKPLSCYRLAQRYLGGGSRAPLSCNTLRASHLLHVLPGVSSSCLTPGMLPPLSLFCTPLCLATRSPETDLWPHASGKAHAVSLVSLASLSLGTIPPQLPSCGHTSLSGNLPPSDRETHRVSRVHAPLPCCMPSSSFGRTPFF